MLRTRMMQVLLADGNRHLFPVGPPKARIPQCWPEPDEIPGFPETPYARLGMELLREVWLLVGDVCAIRPRYLLEYARINTPGPNAVYLAGLQVALNTVIKPGILECVKSDIGLFYDPGVVLLSRIEYRLTLEA